MFDLPRRLLAEFLGTAFLVGTVIGSGIMADMLTDDVALALLGNTIPTGAILVVIITIFSPISGAHFNPAVTLAFAAKGEHQWSEVAPYIAVQIVGGIVGTLVAHAMFDLSILQFSQTARTGLPQWIAEIVATFGLVSLIFAAVKFRPESVAWLVGLYITAAYWFTASTSFANPAVAIARMFSDTFAGIQPIDVPAFIVAQLIGAAIAFLVMRYLLQSRES